MRRTFPILALAWGCAAGEPTPSCGPFGEPTCPAGWHPACRAIVVAVDPADCAVTVEDRPLCRTDAPGTYCPRLDEAPRCTRLPDRCADVASACDGPECVLHAAEVCNREADWCDEAAMRCEAAGYMAGCSVELVEDWSGLVPGREALHPLPSWWRR